MRSPPGSAHRTRPERSPMARRCGGIRATRATCSASSTSCGLTRLAFSASGRARAVKRRSWRASASLHLARQSWAQRCPTARRVNREQAPIMAGRRSILRPQHGRRDIEGCLCGMPIVCWSIVALLGRVSPLCWCDGSSLASVGSLSASTQLRCQSPAALWALVGRDRRVVVAHVPLLISPSHAPPRPSRACHPFANAILSFPWCGPRHSSGGAMVHTAKTCPHGAREETTHEGSPL
jgi:hypothetical protein